MDRYKEIMEEAFLNDRNVQLPKFKGKMEIVHLDGSRFTFYNGVYEIKERWLIAYSEHMHPLVFFKEDLESWKYLL